MTKNCNMSTFSPYFFEDYRIGEEFNIGEFIITAQDIQRFAELTYDFNPLHLDKDYATKSGYKNVISHGLLGVSLCSGIAYKSGLFDKRVVGLISQTMRYKKPIYVDEQLKFTLKVTNKRDIPNSIGGIVIFDTKLMDKNGNILILGEWNVLILKAKTVVPSDISAKSTNTSEPKITE